MALTRGKKKINVPIAGEFSKLGVEKQNTTNFGILAGLMEPLAESLAAKEKFETDLKDATHKEWMADQKSHLIMDANMRKTIEAKRLKDLRQKEKHLAENLKFRQANLTAMAKEKEKALKLHNKIFNLNQKNNVTKIKNRLRLLISENVDGFEIEHLGFPNKFQTSALEWGTSILNDKTFPQEITDSDGVVIGDFREFFDYELKKAVQVKYAPMYSKKIEFDANESWQLNDQAYQNVEGVNTGIIDSIGMKMEFQVNEKVPPFSAQNVITEDNIEQLQLVMQNAMGSFDNWVDGMRTLEAQYPHLFKKNDIQKKIDKARVTYDKHIIASFANAYITGNGHPDTEKTAALGFLNAYLKGSFTENHPDLDAQVISKWTYDKHTDEDKNTIREWVEARINDKVSLSKLENSQMNAEINQSKKLKINIWEGSGIGSFEDVTSHWIPPSTEELKYNYSSTSANGVTTIDKEKMQMAENKISKNLNIKTKFNQIRNGEISFNELVNSQEGKAWGTLPELIDAFYSNHIGGGYTGVEIANRMRDALASENPMVALANDPLLIKFQDAFNITKMYPSSFLDYIKTFEQLDINNENDVANLESVIRIFNTFGMENDGGMDGGAFLALTDATRIYNQTDGNAFAAAKMWDGHYNQRADVDSKDIIDGINNHPDEWFRGIVEDATDESTDRHSWLVTHMGLFGWMYNWDQNPKDDYNISKDIMEGSPTTWYKYLYKGKAGQVEDALNANMPILNFMIKNEAKRIAIDQGKDYSNDSDGMNVLFKSATLNVFKKLQQDNWSFDSHMLNQIAPYNNYPLLTQNSISKYTGWNNDVLGANTIIRIHAIMNAMDPKARIAFWDNENYQQNLNTLNQMWSDNQIKFKFDERTRHSNEPQWHMMINTTEDGQTWKELVIPGDFETSWKPNKDTSFSTSSNLGSIEMIKQDQIKKMTDLVIWGDAQRNIEGLYEIRLNEETQEQELWTKVKTTVAEGAGAGVLTSRDWVKVESGQVDEFDQRINTALSTFLVLIGNDIERFKDIFSDWKDVDTWAEIATENQQEIALKLSAHKQQVENPDPIESKNTWFGVVQTFDVPKSNRIGDNFYLYDHEFVDGNQNVRTYKAIGPAFNLDNEAEAVDILKNLKGKYNDEEIEKIMPGELGITRHDYEELIDMKYNMAAKEYDELYDNTIITSQQRLVLVDIIATMGVQFVGPDSPIYKAIQNNDHYGVFQELQRLSPYYVDKSRHSFHINAWIANSKKKDFYK